MKLRKKKQMPILYEKYKQTSEKKPVVAELKPPRKKIKRVLGDIWTLIILLLMMVLATVGAITLLVPELRFALLEFVIINSAI